MPTGAAEIPPEAGLAIPPESGVAGIFELGAGGAYRIGGNRLERALALDPGQDFDPERALVALFVECAQERGDVEIPGPAEAPVVQRVLE